MAEMRSIVECALPGAGFRPLLSSRYAAVWTAPEHLARLVSLAGNATKLWAALGRLDYYGIADFVATDTITLRLNLPVLRPRLLERLPPALAATYPHTCKRLEDRGVRADRQAPFRPSDQRQKPEGWVGGLAANLGLVGEGRP